MLLCMFDTSAAAASLNSAHLIQSKRPECCRISGEPSTIIGGFGPFQSCGRCSWQQASTMYMSGFVLCRFVKCHKTVGLTGPLAAARCACRCLCPLKLCSVTFPSAGWVSDQN